MMSPAQLEEINYIHMVAAARRMRPATVVADEGLLASLAKFRAWLIVPCGEQLHVIAVSRRGRIGFLHHSVNEVKHWRNWRALGGEMPGTTPASCLAWLKMLAPAPARTELVLAGLLTVACVPPRLSRLMKIASMKRVARRYRRNEAVRELHNDYD